MNAPSIAGRIDTRSGAASVDVVAEARGDATNAVLTPA